MFNWLGQKLTEPFVRSMLQSVAEMVIAFLVTKTVSEVSKFVGKFIPVGGAIFGRVSIPQWCDCCLQKSRKSL